MANAHRIRLGQPVRVLQQSGEIVEADRDAGMVRPETRLVDRQRPAIERFRLCMQRLCVEQQAEVVHQPRGRYRDLLSIRSLDHA
jgi:hypothetical protein